MYKKLIYNTKYLPTELIEKCFVNSQYNFVDKQITGNGFTTGFLKLRPSEPYQSNIIIVPNKQVIKSKQKSYLKDNDINKTSIGFFYGDDSSNVLKFGKFDVMMFVVDSFLNYLTLIEENIYAIDKILIDEVHSILIQSTFRKRLVNFTETIKTKFQKNAIVSVTATPLLFQKIDIKLIKKNIKKRVINISKNQENTLENIKKSILKGNNVIVALQDVRLLKKLSDDQNKLRANLKVGVTLFRKIVENVNLILDTSSNLTIISSAGFEGFDVDNGINDIFIFEDRAFDYQTFYSQNIIQIIGRSRKGTGYIEWCRMSNNSRTALLSKDEMIKKSKSTKISFEKKMTDKNYSFIPKYFDYDQDLDFGVITDLKFNPNKYGLAKELNDSDLLGLNIYNDFFSERGFCLKHLNNGAKRLNLRNVSNKQAFKNIKKNKDIVRRFELMNDLRIDLYPKEKIDYYIKAFEVFLRRKYWYSDKLLWEMSENELKGFIEANNTEECLNELFGYSILKDEKSINEALRVICKKAIQKKLDKICVKSKEFISWKKDLIENSKDRYIRLIMALSQHKIIIPKKIRNSRDYNLLTEVSLDLIIAVAELFNIDIYEIDIISCNIRIIYAFCGLKLPSDFYGKDKEKKKKINKLLNKLSIEFPKEFKIDERNYKNKRIEELRKLGFHEKVISFLIDEFWYRRKDALFNFCTYHEKKIINSLSSKLINTKTEGRYIRRHDSIISFGKLNDIQVNEIINFEYMNQCGWFVKELKKDLFLENKFVKIKTI